MRKLGIIGGMSWVSTRIYYEQINKRIQKRTTPMTSAPLLIESLDFCALYGLTKAEDWDRAADVISASAKRLEAAGASAIVIAANSMHKVYDQVAANVAIPILHIADAVGARMQADGVTQATLLGTRNVMTESFFRQRLVAHGVDLTAPVMANVEILETIIYDELMVGKVTRDAQRALKTIITRKEQDGVKAIVLACTELDMIVDVDANILPIYDSARIHCEAAVRWIMDED
ncbi:aspartate/glutamate racemase family protein [Pontixanthobacter sp.]|uniref:aspartate/glutamate racemase family protein n=1 Tax=Pontixanthobacter sp. TaxID=2792078 RepID=UPI003C79A473